MDGSSYLLWTVLAVMSIFPPRITGSNIGWTEFKCPDGHRLSLIESVFQLDRRRVYNFDCSSLSDRQITVDKCIWTLPEDSSRGDIFLACQPKTHQYIAGVSILKQGSREQWKLRCCSSYELEVQTKKCYQTRLVNKWGRAFQYTMPDHVVSRKWQSLYNDTEQDRKWWLEVCPFSVVPDVAYRQDSLPVVIHATPPRTQSTDSSSTTTDTPESTTTIHTTKHPGESIRTATPGVEPKAPAAELPPNRTTEPTPLPVATQVFEYYDYDYADTTQQQLSYVEGLQDPAVLAEILPADFGLKSAGTNTDGVLINNFISNNDTDNNSDTDRNRSNESGNYGGSGTETNVQSGTNGGAAKLRQWNFQNIFNHFVKQNESALKLSAGLLSNSQPLKKLPQQQPGASLFFPPNAIGSNWYPYAGTQHHSNLGQVVALPNVAGTQNGPALQGVNDQRHQQRRQQHQLRQQAKQQQPQPTLPFMMPALVKNEKDIAREQALLEQHRAIQETQEKQLESALDSIQEKQRQRQLLADPPFLHRELNLPGLHIEFSHSIDTAPATKSVPATVGFKTPSNANKQLPIVNVKSPKRKSKSRSRRPESKAKTRTTSHTRKATPKPRSKPKALPKRPGALPSRPNLQPFNLDDLFDEEPSTGRILDAIDGVDDYEYEYSDEVDDSRRDGSEFLPLQDGTVLSLPSVDAAPRSKETAHSAPIGFPPTEKPASDAANPEAIGSSFLSLLGGASDVLSTMHKGAKFAFTDDTGNFNFRDGLTTTLDYFGLCGEPQRRRK